MQAQCLDKSTDQLRIPGQTNAIEEVQPYLPVEQLGLRPSIAFDFIADAVEERDSVLVFVKLAEFS